MASPPWSSGTPGPSLLMTTEGEEALSPRPRDQQVEADQGTEAGAQDAGGEGAGARGGGWRHDTLPTQPPTRVGLTKPYSTPSLIHRAHLSRTTHPSHETLLYPVSDPPRPPFTKPSTRRRQHEWRTSTRSTSGIASRIRSGARFVPTRAPEARGGRGGGELVAESSGLPDISADTHRCLPTVSSTKIIHEQQPDGMWAIERRRVLRAAASQRRHRPVPALRSLL